MATALNNTVDTLANWTKGRDPDLKAASVVEILNQSNEMTSFLQWQQANAPWMNRTTVRTVLPTVSSRQLGQGVVMSTSRVGQFDDAMSILDVFNEVDCKLAEASGDVAGYRLRAGLPFWEALYQKFAYLLFYGNSATTPSDFYGLSSRYATVNPATANNAQNVLDGLGTSSVNASMWLLTLGDKALTGIFPAGSPVGIYHEDWGRQNSTITAGYGASVLPVYRDQYQWTCGVALKDWRWCVRIANIDTTNLVAESGAADLFKLMDKAMYRLPSIATPPSTTGNPMSSIATPGVQIWACNRTMREMLSVQASNKVSNQLGWMDYQGRKVLAFMGIPIVNVDQLSNAEAQVV